VWISWLDPEQTSLPLLNAASASAALKDRTLKTRLAYVERGARVWAFVDTDGDGKLDAVLATQDVNSGAATRAFAIDEKGKSVGERPELIGTLIGAPLTGLDDKSRDRLSICERVARLPWRASGKGQAGMPHPIFDVGSDIVFETGAGGVGVLSVEGAGTEHSSALLFDLRGDPKKPRKPADVEKRARLGDFNAAFAWVSKGRVGWFLYDTDGKAGFDYAVFVADGQTTSLSFDGTRWKVDAGASQKPLRPSLFKDPKLQAALKAVASTYFLSLLTE